MISLDTSEVAKLAADLRRAGPTISPKLSGRLTAHANAAAREMRGGAPKDRPWLSTEEGIQVETVRALERRIFSPPDPDGQSVGYRVVFGTSVMPPRPEWFLEPYRRHRDAFNQEALKIVASVL